MSIPSTTKHNVISHMEIDGYFMDKEGKKRLEATWFTPWSFAHFCIGIFARAIQMPFIFAMIVHTVYEMIHLMDPRMAAVWRKSGYPWFYGDSTQNCIGDTIAMAAGFYLTDFVLKYAASTNNDSKRGMINKIYFGVVILSSFIFVSKKAQAPILEARRDYMDNTYGLKSKKIDGKYINILGIDFIPPWVYACIAGLTVYIMYLMGKFTFY